MSMVGKFKEGCKYVVDVKDLKQHGRTFTFRNGRASHGHIDTPHAFHFHDDFVLAKWCKEIETTTGEWTMSKETPEQREIRVCRLRIAFLEGRMSYYRDIILRYQTVHKDLMKDIRPECD